MRIVLFEMEDWERESLQPLAEEHSLDYRDQELTEANAGDAEDAEIVSTFIYSRLSPDVLERLPKLKLIATRSTGVDHIDMDYCRDRGITVCNVPIYGENTVAEHVFALLLAISHRLLEAVERTRSGSFTSTGLQGFDLQGKTIGVVGTGNIGRHVIRIARGFAMDVLAMDLEPDDAFAQEQNFRYVNLDELLEHADVVTLHVPGTPDTRHLLSTEEFATMKPGAVLINTSRGTVVDVRALLHALTEGRLRAAGLDVLPEEPTIHEEAELLRAVFQERQDLNDLLADQVLLRMRNVIITPHSAFNTREAVHRILDTTRDNIQAFVDGRPCNTVDS